MTFELSKMEQGAIAMYEEGERGVNILAAIQGAADRLKEEERPSFSPLYPGGSTGRKTMLQFHEAGIPQMSVDETLQAVKELR